MRNTKKGFTLVELLVVIAILAILATVSVVGYTSFIEKANLSNDQATIGMINNNLQAASVNNRPTTAGDAIALLAGCGFYGDKFDAYTEGYHYAYNLTNNKFYLLDDEDNVVYPEECDKSQLWGLYRNRPSDRISGVEKYVAMASVVNNTYLAQIFTEGAYEIDLNKHAITTEAPAGVTFTVKNGFSTVSDYVTAGNGVTKVNEYKAEIHPNGVDGVVTYENLYIPNTINLKDIINKNGGESTTTIIIRNCVIDGNGNSSRVIFNSNITKIIIEDCVLMSSETQKAALTIQQYGDDDGEVNTNIIIRNNIFVNTGRGIDFNQSYGNTVLIENNTFTLSDTYAININRVSDTQITIKDNTMVSGETFIKVYNGSKGYFTDDEVNNVTFVNNTISDAVKNKAVGDNTTESEQTAALLASKVK